MPIPDSLPFRDKCLVSLYGKLGMGMDETNRLGADLEPEWNETMKRMEQPVSCFFPSLFASHIRFPQRGEDALHLFTQCQPGRGKDRKGGERERARVSKIGPASRFR